MGSRYTTQSASGYNSSPPADDGSQTASNLVTYAGIKTKLGDPVKTLADAVNTALLTAMDYSVRQVTGSDSILASDHMRTVEIAPTVSASVSIALADAATMTSNFIVRIRNSSTISQTIARATSGDTIDGVAANITLPSKAAVTFTTNAAATGYLTTGYSGPKIDTDPIVVGSSDGTKKVAFEVDGLTTATTRTVTIPDKSGTMAMTSDISTAPPRSYLAGLTLSTAGSSATMTIAAGAAADSTNTAMMTLAASISKTTSAWAVGSGNGGLDTGAIANSTWYHFYEIQRPDTGVVDVVFSTNASSPTLPTNYTLYRRIGSGKTNGSAQWILFVQNGDTFLWDAPVLDVNATNPGTSAVTPTMTTPSGIVTEHIGNWQLNDNSDGTSGVLVSSMLVADRAASTSAAPLNSLSGFDGSVGGMTVFASGQIRTLTDTSSRVRYRCYVSGGSTIVSCATTGWIDRRGRDA